MKDREKSLIFTAIFSTKNRKGISGVIVVIMMIALVLVAVVLVWGVINNLLTGEIEQSSSCFGIFDDFSIGKRYTCYDSDNGVLRFQITRKDIDMSGGLISVSGNLKSESFTLTNEYQEINNLVNYSGGGSETKLPEKNSGITYNLTWPDTDNPPDRIQVAPKIGENQCETSDTLTKIDDCSLLA